MTLLRTAPLLLAAAAVLASCRPAEPHQPPPLTQYTSFEEAARGSADVAGTFPLTHVGGRALPADYAFHHGCMVSVTGGELTLTADGRYRLRLLSSTVCGGDDRHETGEVTKEGLYALQGFNLRFGDKMLITTSEPAPEVTTGDEDLVYTLFPEGRFSAEGTARFDRITVTLRDLHTLAFARG